MNEGKNSFSYLISIFGLFRAYQTAFMTSVSFSSIDVIIPSYRMEEHALLQIFNLRRPVGFEVNFILVCDNPGVAVPVSVQALSDQGKINLLINEKNSGPSFTRNRGIDISHGNWILFLDDDIVPSSDLLLVYAAAIKATPDSLGFVGVTEFPTPFNRVTEALKLNGAVGFFAMSRSKKEQAWAPTANLMLNRSLLGPRRFSSALTIAGEDVELMARNSQANGQLYTSLPEAVVFHPWWDKGRSQLKRMFRYGYGNATILRLPHIWKYSHLDFSNTVESVFIVVLITPLLIMVGVDLKTPLILIGIVLLAELITNMIRAIKVSGRFSSALIWQMMLHKNAQEVGFFWALLKSGRWLSMCRMIDFGFKKPYPSPFRLNRWKIVKLVVTVILLLLLMDFN